MTSQSSSKRAATKRQESERKLKETALRVEVERKEIGRRLELANIEAQLEVEVLDDRLRLSDSLNQLAIEEEVQENKLDEEISHLRNIDLTDPAAVSQPPIQHHPQVTQFTRERRRLDIARPVANDRLLGEPRMTHALPLINQQSFVPRMADAIAVNNHHQYPMAPSLRSYTYKLPKITIKPFDGNIIDYPMFISNFKSLAAQRLSYLRLCLSPDIQNSIAQYLYDPSFYDRALEELEYLYGNSYLVALAHLKVIKNIPKVNESSPEAMQNFVMKLNGAVGPLSVGNYKHELASSGLLGRLVGKIPVRFQSKWGDEVFKALPIPPTVLTFCQWLRNAVRAESFVNPINLAGQFSDNIRVVTKAHARQGKPEASARHRTSAIFATTNTSESSPVAVCPACQGTHELFRCDTFRGLTVADRSSLVREHRLCFRCLKGGHLKTDCLFKGRCHVCKDTHNSLLHRGTTQPVVHVVGATDQIPMVGTAVKARETVLLGVVPVRISANGRTVETHALLDTGSQLTLVRHDIAEKLGASGPQQNLTFGTFHGRDPKVATRRVSMSISAMDNSSSFFVAAAYSVEQLNMSPVRVSTAQLKS